MPLLLVHVLRFCGVFLFQPQELNAILEKQPGPEVLEQLEQYQEHDWRARVRVVSNRLRHVENTAPRGARHGVFFFRPCRVIGTEQISCEGSRAGCVSFGLHEVESNTSPSTSVEMPKEDSASETVAWTGTRTSRVLKKFHGQPVGNDAGPTMGVRKHCHKCRKRTGWSGIGWVG